MSNNPEELKYNSHVLQSFDSYNRNISSNYNTSSTTLVGNNKHIQ